MVEVRGRLVQYRLQWNESQTSIMQVAHGCFHLFVRLYEFCGGLAEIYTYLWFI
jgi:hypothetical protein